jgi:hypothetical protein
MREPRFTLASPEVIAILSGVHRSTKKSYYRIVDGRHVSCSVKIELMSLGIAGATASKLLQTADLPSAPFIFNRTAARRKVVAETEVEKEREVTVEVYEAAIECPVDQELGEVAATPAATSEMQLVEPKPVPTTETPSKKTGPKAMSEDEREEKRLRKEEAENTKRYQLIQQGAYHGVWDDTSAAVITLWHTKAEAIEELAKIKSGRIYAGICNWGSYKPQRSKELQESHS